MNTDRYESGSDGLQARLNPVSNRRLVQKDYWPGFLWRGLMFAFGWWILVEGQSASWWIGAPAVVLATLASVRLLSPVNLVWYELFRFVPFFIIRSLLGGVDVAWRAVHPGMPISPCLVKYPIQLPSELARVFMANTVSLLPGTLSARLAPGCLTVHVLTVREDMLSQLETVEKRVAALFGLTLPASAGVD